MHRPTPDPPGPGQESVWDYPRPPRVDRTARRVRIEFGGDTLVDTDDVVRVLETSHPPVYYVPIDAFAPGTLAPAEGSSFCEYKGAARYFDVTGGGQVRRGAAWYYPEPSAGYELLRGRVAVYAAPMDHCTVDGVEVVPQPGGFYGGWITPDVAGPFKGTPGSMGW
ncbi:MULTISPECIES: DUF427 domain-containing protein [Microbacterium]|uniref:DUF427 domain-containing protein n=1 Tax=Microbacterium wangchenii TaxID=2541726 RepID=A0ABX5SUL6_9MICO|nr:MULTISPECIES: DUF427 domain-containing protein [Microbacterium]MCK6065073.1 DUF427 domain-containing protein [Microbacterium sp. EYE_512]QBR88535.1 DUF427 domain-containing protein [Microbacterium wangchenii]TXK20262.1 DUF427 domain-containing protein [Microbacterium wangchenii]